LFSNVLEFNGFVTSATVQVIDRKVPGSLRVRVDGNPEDLHLDLRTLRTTAATRSPLRIELRRSRPPRFLISLANRGRGKYRSVTFPEASADCGFLIQGISWEESRMATGPSFSTLDAIRRSIDATHAAVNSMLASLAVMAQCIDTARAAVETSREIVKQTERTTVTLHRDGTAPPPQDEGA
jgi:hypothetical protein